ncbi:MAG: hypothetical protein LUE06_06540 [Oscillospiraceae bacterium]|nr:hypothetical protein [Oscillospiraceae bacterium]MCD8100225.1 hypothetical protein [Oscillospiraceae bacterium]MCD8255277.1 hypothetical protein [Oscillospiraceae bacterium]MCD8343862.1 hypothetical protein [Oscillospiraceae bacterium]MCD8374769.1 hypothetical protein [Oscillospiraceae bacterium]
MLSIVSVVLIVLNLIFSNFLGGILWYIALAILIYAYFRILSRNIDKRRSENAAYLRARSRVTDGFRNWRDRSSQRRDYCFFRCPSCKSMLRVPRGKGKIRVTCRKCGTAFEKRT